MNKISYPTVCIDKHEPPPLVDELAELGYEVENRVLKQGDFIGKTTIGEIKHNLEFSNIAKTRKLVF
ncbi:MAG: hypothetical protein ACXACR_07650 [Candidatus Hodarchaeales archaeon]